MTSFIGTVLLALIFVGIWSLPVDRTKEAEAAIQASFTIHSEADTAIPDMHAVRYAQLPLIPTVECK